ncbi:MAG: SEC-C domain-containing protein [Solirubrobacterales bacterium]|nr:SEC-C domain-containing protein [Solirubrobacterales bacterium]
MTMMDKTGRNDPCPCGSGKKYKKCCLPTHEAEQRQRAAEQQAERDKRTAEHRASLRAARATHIQALAGFEDEADELTTASNAAVDLVRAGKLDEAERVARDLLERFPEVHDGWDRLGMVYEARGENRAAADCYRKVIAFIREHADDYDPEFEDNFVKLVDKLDPPPA